MTRIHVNLPDDLCQMAEDLARERGHASVAEYLRSLLQDAVQQAPGSAAPESVATPEPAQERPPLSTVAAEVGASVPADAWGLLPSDLAANFDHYRYGRPREG